MVTAYRRWACGLLAGVLVLLIAAGAVVWAADPCFYLRLPEGGKAVAFNERYQNAGLARQAQADTVVLGTSMVANYRPSQIAEVFGGSAVRLTVPDGYLSEFDTTLEAVFAAHPPERVIFGLDPNILVRSVEEAPDQLPAYLYDTNPWNDSPYLLNKDVLVRALYVVREKAAGNTQALQDAFVWDGNVFFSKELALAGYQRPEAEDTVLPEDAFFDICDENLAVVETWLTEHPDTEFIFYYSPYSIWDKMERQGRTDAMFAVLKHATEALLAYDNVKIQCFLTDIDIITDLDNYADHIHVAGRVTWKMSKAMAGTEHLLTLENYEAKLDALREYVVNYDYDKFWDDYYWYQFHTPAGAKT